MALTSVVRDLVCRPGFTAEQQAKKGETQNRADAVRSPEIPINVYYLDGPVRSASGNKARATIGDASIPNSTTLRPCSISNTRRPSLVWVIAYFTYRLACIILVQAKFQDILYLLRFFITLHPHSQLLPTHKPSNLSRAHWILFSPPVTFSISWCDQLVR